MTKTREISIITAQTGLDLLLHSLYIHYETVDTFVSFERRHNGQDQNFARRR